MTVFSSLQSARDYGFDEFDTDGLFYLVRRTVYRGNQTFFELAYARITEEDKTDDAIQY